MPQRDDEDTLTRVFRRMGEPSWWILRVLSATEPIPHRDHPARASPLGHGGLSDEAASIRPRYTTR